MATRIKHKFHSDKPDGADTTRARPSDWNDDHDFTLEDDTGGDVSTAKHGFAPKAPGDRKQALLGDGAFGLPQLVATVAGARRAGATAPESWYTGLMCLGGLTTLAMTANRLYVHPFLVAKGQTADRIAVCVTAAASSDKKLRLGIYKDSNGYPGDLELDCGEVTADATGLRMVTINKALTPGLWWLAVVVEEAATVRALYHYYTLGIIGFPASGGTPTVSYTSPTGYYMAHTYGALPASFAAYASATEITASACPAVFLRFSA